MICDMHIKRGGYRASWINNKSRVEDNSKKRCHLEQKYLQSLTYIIYITKYRDEYLEKTNEFRYSSDRRDDS